MPYFKKMTAHRLIHANNGTEFFKLFMLSSSLVRYGPR